MRFLLSLLIFMLLCSSSSLCQTSVGRFTAEMPVAGKGNSLFLSYSRLFSTGKSKVFSLGPSIQLTGSYVENRQIIFRSSTFSTITEDTRDSLELNSLAMEVLNAGMLFSWKVAPKWHVSLQVDLVGLSFGIVQPAKYYGNNAQVYLDTIQPVAPTPANFMMGFLFDKGSLVHKVSVQHHLNKSFSVTAGMSLLIREFTSGRLLIGSQDRYRNTVLLPFIGICFSNEYWKKSE